MAIFNGNRVFSAKKTKSMPIVKCPKNVRQALNIDEVYRLGSFKLEPKKKQAMYDRTYLFEDINYINKNVGDSSDGIRMSFTFFFIEIKEPVSK